MEIKELKKLKPTLKKLTKKNQPVVCVVVTCYNSSARIKACLDSIRRSNYKNYKIIVIDNKSSDNTKLAVEQYKRKHPKLSLSTYYKRKNSNAIELFKQANKIAKEYDLLLFIKGENIISPLTIKECAGLFLQKQDLEAIRLEQSLTGGPSLIMTLNQLFQTTSNYFLKLRGLFLLKNVDFDANLMFRKNAFNKILPTKKVKIKIKYKNASNIYESGYAESTLGSLKSISVHKKSVKLTNKKQMIITNIFFLTKNLIVVITAIFIPILLTYFIYSAVSLQGGKLLLYSWIIITIWFFAVIWSGNHILTKDKIRQTFLVPSMLIVIYFYAIFIVITTIKEIFSWVLIFLHRIKKPNLSFATNRLFASHPKS